MKPPNEKPDLDRIPHVADKPPVDRYVNFLLYDMFKKALPARKLVRSEPLPDVRTPMGTMSGGSVAFDRVVGRLKVISGLEPVRCEQPLTREVELNIDGTPVAARLRFDDQCPDPYCEVTMKPAGS